MEPIKTCPDCEVEISAKAIRCRKCAQAHRAAFPEIYKARDKKKIDPYFLRRGKKQNISMVSCFNGSEA